MCDSGEQQQQADGFSAAGETSAEQVIAQEQAARQQRTDARRRGDGHDARDPRDGRGRGRDAAGGADDGDGDGEGGNVQAPLIEPEQLRSWIICDDADVLVVNKPGWVVCHPSKNGPWSSLVGACRELTGAETLHLIARLDRETSGLVIMAKHRAAARRLQMAIERRAVKKEYLAILHGEMTEPVSVKQPLAKDLESAIASKVTVRRSNSAKSATTHFYPLGSAGGYTLARVDLETGRKHQIRAHALWLGHPVAGDKVYGADETLFLEFIEQGWTPRLAAALPLERQALHCASMTFTDVEGTPSYAAKLPDDMRGLLERCGLGAVLAEQGL